eukprot:GILI01018205.1.p1 GENE.GILI01018205.1~~GILI01018205.1.p1  ORF type:complete len:843 (-),score=122.56 GILI01018205.1:104-2416(-)
MSGDRNANNAMLRRADQTATMDTVDLIYAHYYRRIAPTDRNVREQRPLLWRLFSVDQQLPSSLHVLKEMAKHRTRPPAKVKPSHEALHSAPQNPSPEPSGPVGFTTSQPKVKRPSFRPSAMPSQSPSEIICSLTAEDIHREEARSLALRAVLLQRKVEEERRREEEERFDEGDVGHSCVASDHSSHHTLCGASSGGITTTRASSIGTEQSGGGGYLFQLSNKYANAANKIRDKHQQQGPATASSSAQPLLRNYGSSLPIPFTATHTSPTTIPPITSSAPTHKMKRAAIIIQAEARRYLATGRHQRMSALMSLTKLLAGITPSKDQPTLSFPTNTAGVKTGAKPSLVAVPYLIRCACECEDLIHIDHIATANANNDIYAALAADPDVGPVRALHFLKLAFAVVDDEEDAVNEGRLPLRTSFLPTADAIEVLQLIAERCARHHDDASDGTQPAHFTVDPSELNARKLLADFTGAEQSIVVIAFIQRTLKAFEPNQGIKEVYLFYKLLASELGLNQSLKIETLSSLATFDKPSQKSAGPLYSSASAATFDPAARMLNKRLTRGPEDSDEEGDITALHQLLGIEEAVAALGTNSDNDNDDSEEGHHETVALVRSGRLGMAQEGALMAHVRQEMDRNYVEPTEGPAVLDHKRASHDGQRASIAHTFAQPLMRLPFCPPASSEIIRDSQPPPRTQATSILADGDATSSEVGAKAPPPTSKECVICELDADNVRLCAVCNRWFHEDCGVIGMRVGEDSINPRTQVYCSRRCCAGSFQ